MVTRGNDVVRLDSLVLLVYVCLFVGIFFFGLVCADPVGPGTSSINITKNETYNPGTTATGTLVNISGGYIAGVNISSSVQNTKWKAFVGWVSGELVLGDASGDKIYDWALTTSTGKVYATRTSGTVNWPNIDCSNRTFMEAENVLLSHSSAVDNLTATFNLTTGASHSGFVVAGKAITASTCPTLNTYINNQTQDSDFEEMALDDGSYLVYTTLLESALPGFDGTAYDFQMLVPQNASAGSSNTPYYVYIEIT